MFLITCCATFVFCIINAVNNVRVNYFYHCIPTFAPPCIYCLESMSNQVDISFHCLQVLWEKCEKIFWEDQKKLENSCFSVVAVMVEWL